MTRIGLIMTNKLTRLNIISKLNFENITTTQNFANIINDNNFPDNKIFLQKLKEKDTLFNQDVDKNKTYKSKKR